MSDITSPDHCSESPLGFYRGEVVYFEWVAYNDGIYQTLPVGGHFEFIGFYLGQWEPCKPT